MISLRLAELCAFFLLTSARKLLQSVPSSIDATKASDKFYHFNYFMLALNTSYWSDLHAYSGGNKEVSTKMLQIVDCANK